MSASAPLVSIGLPVYNGARYLREAVGDLLAQSLGDFELILSDNASTDGSGRIADELAREDARIRVVHNTRNVGALPNANQAFRMARGRYYALAAHDDRHAPDFLARLVEALEADSEAILAYGRSALIGEDGRRLRYDAARGTWSDAAGHTFPYDRALERALPDEPVARFRAVLRARDVNSPIHGLFRRDALARLTPHQLYGSDRLLVAQAALHGRFAFVDEPLFEYRMHPGSTFFLDRAAWAARETGRADAAPPWSPARTFARYWHAAAAAPLPLDRRAAACAATLGYALRADALRRLVVPGRDNYLGLRGRPSLTA